MANFCLSEAILERFKSAENELGYSEHIVKLDCDYVDSWEFRDRKSFELGNIDQLAMSIQHGGQCQPIVVVRTSSIFRPKEDPTAQYVVIAGYRRWMACKKFRIDVLAVVRTINFEQAITVLVSENEKETVSDYSKGMFYNTLLATKKISEEQLCERLSLTSNSLKHYLTFAQVPEEIWNAVGDLSRVSAKTSSLILSYVLKGPEYIAPIIQIADKIAHGYGEKRIKEEIECIIECFFEKKDKCRTQENIINHKVKWNGKLLMTVNHNRIRLNKSLSELPSFKELVATIETQVTDFAIHHFPKKGN